MRNFQKLWLVLTPIAMFCVPAQADDTILLGLPVDCDLGATCFLQQMPDMDPSTEARDPFGGEATYDGHKGTDIRLRYMADIDKNVAVIASASGTVMRLRDGVADQIVRTEADRAEVRDQECGNGVIIAHDNDWQTQYCHLKNGSIKVREGQKVVAGDVLGHIGASGMAQFPHVHIELTRQPYPIDPFSTAPLAKPSSPMLTNNTDFWSDDKMAGFGSNPTQILDMGMTDGVINHDDLVFARPKEASQKSGALVGYGSLINLQKGDIVGISIIGPDGQTFAENKIAPLDRAKASYSLFAGKRGAPKAGKYTVEVFIARDGKPYKAETREFDIF